MKHLFYLFAAIILASCQGNSSSSFHISGHISGLDSGMVYLLKAQNQMPLMLDTAEIKNGKFFFKGDVENPSELHFLRLNDRELLAMLFLEPGKTNVKAYVDSLNATKVTGSDETDVLNIYLGEVNSLVKRIEEYNRRYTQARSQDEANRYQIEYKASIDNMYVFIKNFVRENSSSPVAAYITLTQLSNQLEFEELKEIKKLFAPELSKSVYLKELDDILEKMGKTAVGVLAPDFTINDSNGNPVKLSSFRGKYLLIDFWASWCQPCREENPNIVTAYAKYKNKGFEILGVSLDQSKNDWLNAISTDKLEWVHVLDSQKEAVRLYEVASIPHSILLDKEGKIIAKNLRDNKLDETLSKLMP